MLIFLANQTLFEVGASCRRWSVVIRGAVSLNLIRMLFPVLLSMYCSSCGFPRQDVHAPKEITSTIARLCKWTSMGEPGRIRSVERWNTEEPGYNVRLHIASTPYLILFNSAQKLVGFQPEYSDLSELGDILATFCPSCVIDWACALGAVEECRTRPSTHHPRHAEASESGEVTLYVHEAHIYYSVGKWRCCPLGT